MLGDTPPLPYKNSLNRNIGPKLRPSHEVVVSQMKDFQEKAPRSA